MSRFGRGDQKGGCTQSVSLSKVLVLVLHKCSPRSPSSALLPFFAEGSPTKIDYGKEKKTGTLILSSLLEDLARKQ